MCSFHFWLNFVVNLAVAVGTLLAVVVALGLGKRWFPPKLKMGILDTLGEKTVNTYQVAENLSAEEDVRFFHIKVWNDRRWSPANQTQVFLTAIQQKGPNGQWRVTWSGDVPMRWRDQEVTSVTQTIGGSRHSDFCMVGKTRRMLALTPLIFPNNLKWLWKGSCEFIARLQARSTEADSEELYVRVSWSGEWEDGAIEMRNQLQVEIYEKPSR